MRSRANVLARLHGETSSQVPAGVPEAEYVVAPAAIDDLSAGLEEATRLGLRVLVWGRGLHQGYGHSVDADVVVVTTGLRRVLEFEPDDLTVVTETGITVADLEAQLASAGRTAVLPEDGGNATLGGVVAAGLSGWRRLRYGPTRDRLLQVTLVTGDGRVVTAGGRVVKNVTGYDIPRLAAGSFGSLGVIAAVCLKLWPVPPYSATVTTDDPEEALRRVYRPLAVLETNGESQVYLAGTRAEVEGQAAALGAEAVPGLSWPELPAAPNLFTVRVPPSRTGAAVAALQDSVDDVRFVAAHGVGEVRVAAQTIGEDDLRDLRRWAEGQGGKLVTLRTDFDVDPWGTPPDGVDLQRRVKAAFDPASVMNPGRLPGSI